MSGATATLMFLAVLTRPVDADSFVVEGLAAGRQVEVRLIGVEAPETYRTAGRRAAEVVERWLHGATLEVHHANEYDVYGRLLVWVKPVGWPVSLNTRLVFDGLARPYITDSPALFFAEQWRPLAVIAALFGFQVWFQLRRRRTPRRWRP